MIRGFAFKVASGVKTVQEHISVTDKVEEHSRIERSSAILETEHHVDFVNPEILSNYWPIYRDRISAEQWFISHQAEASKTTHSAWNLFKIWHNAKVPPAQPKSAVNYWFHGLKMQMIDYFFPNKEGSQTFWIKITLTRDQSNLFIKTSANLPVIHNSTEGRRKKQQVG